MKKNILYVMAWIGIASGMVMSCTDFNPDTGSDDSGTPGKQITLNVACPVKTDIGENNTLRGILEVRSGDQMLYREEALAEQGSDTFKFEFEAEEGTYSYVLWADCVPSDAAAPSGEGRYADAFYNTADLHNVSLKKDISLMSDDAAQCFYGSGEIQKGEMTLTENVKLTPAFVKVSVREKNLNEFSYLTSVTLSFSAAQAFDAFSGSVTGNAVNSKVEDADFDPTSITDGTIFSVYLFADAEKRYINDMKFALTKSLGAGETKMEEFSVPENMIALLQGEHVVISGSMMDADERDNEYFIDYDLDVEDWTSSEIEIK